MLTIPSYYPTFYAYCLGKFVADYPFIPPPPLYAYCSGKFVGDSKCEKLPIEICGAGCTFEVRIVEYTVFKYILKNYFNELGELLI